MSDAATPSTSGAVPADTPEHDAWLREALRHAPDATAAPPISLREAILAEARAATRAGLRGMPAISLADRFAELWSWLARPPVAAGFASVMAATLVGLMWWDRPMDEAMPQAPEPVVAAAAPTAEANRPASVSPAPLAGPATTTPATAPPATPPVPAAKTDSAQRRAFVPAQATPAQAAPPQAAPPQAAPPQAAPPRAAPAERGATGATKTAPAADALREERKDAAKTQSNAAPPAPAAPSPFPMRDQRDKELQAAPARPEPAALAKKAEKSDQDEKRGVAAGENRLAAATPAPVEAATTGALGRSTGTSNEASASGGHVAAQTQPAPALRQRAAEAFATARPMAPLLSTLANETARWSRPTPSGESVAIDGAVQAWLARVDAAATQWQQLFDHLSRLDSGLVSAPEANTLLLYRDGRPGAIVKIDDGGVVFEPRPGPAWFAPLTPEAVARLRATLPATR